ncbi:hypothetical protein [Variovorax paradoxus]
MPLQEKPGMWRRLATAHNEKTHQIQTLLSNKKKEYKGSSPNGNNGQK